MRQVGGHGSDRFGHERGIRLVAGHACGGRRRDLQKLDRGRHHWKRIAPGIGDSARENRYAGRRASAEDGNNITHLSQAGIGADFQLIVDNGCLHNMSDGDRDAYVREVSAVAAPDARLLIVAFLPGGRFGVRGIDADELERRFASAWTLLSAGHERELGRC